MTGVLTCLIIGGQIALFGPSETGSALILPSTNGIAILPDGDTATEFSVGLTSWRVPYPIAEVTGALRNCGAVGGGQS